MSKFTKGSWVFRNKYILSKDRIIAEVMTTEINNDFKANGRLLAAAPEMYELLRRYVDLLYEWGTQPDIYADTLEILARIDGEEVGHE